MWSTRIFISKGKHIQLKRVPPSITDGEKKQFVKLLHRPQLQRDSIRSLTTRGWTEWDRETKKAKPTIAPNENDKWVLVSFCLETKDQDTKQVSFLQNVLLRVPFRNLISIHMVPIKRNVDSLQETVIHSLTRKIDQYQNTFLCSIPHLCILLWRVKSGLGV